MLQVNNKFNIGDEVYILSQQPTVHICPVCKGKGSFMHNGAKILCPQCDNGKLFDNINKIYQVMGKQKITGIRTNTHDGINFSIRYNVSGNKRAEDRVFATKEEAETRCKELNEGLEIPKLDTSPLGSDVIEETFWQK